MRMEDLSRLSLTELAPALKSDLYVVFGASWIKGPLLEFLVQKGAVNIHMGVSPYFRGASCNFWAIHDDRADLVGATIHVLTAGLDSGPMLFHALPAPRRADPFLLGMLAVRAGHRGLVHHIKNGSLARLPQRPQDRTQEIRYARHSDFTDGVAEAYLSDPPSADDIEARLRTRNLSSLWNPYIDS
jgi:methionyl-tRNA formyltransferase